MTNLWMLAAIVNSVLIVLLIGVLVMQGRAFDRDRREWLAMHERSLRVVHKFYRATLKAIGNVQTIGTPTPASVEMSHEPDAEERVQRMISEDTIQRGMQALRDTVYRGQAVEEETLRSEVMTMLGGNEPRPHVIVGVPKD